MKTIFKKALLVIAIVGLSSSISLAQSKKAKQSKAKATVINKKTSRSQKNKVVTNNKQNMYLHKSVRVNSVPNGAKHVYYNNVKYSHHNGIFYKKSGNSFVTIIPPVGLRLVVLPARANRVVIGSKNYYHYSGTYYRNFNGRYEVVHNPYNNTYVIN